MFRASLQAERATALLLGVLAALAANAQPQTLAATRIYISPDAAPIDGGIVSFENGRITAVGERGDVRSGATPLSGCDGGVITAGFQNNHVHFMGDGFEDARSKSADSLATPIGQMLIRYGYTTVVDTASDRDNTLTIRARIDKGELPGPRILTLGLPIFPHAGLPAYIAHLPKEFLDRMPQPETPAEAVRVVRENVAAGTDGTKLFIATPQFNHATKRMPAPIAAAAAAETHRHGQLVMAHPTDIDGVRAALAAGGRVIFGTDVGYMTDFDPTEEYVLMAQASLTPMQILASLTTVPAKLWKEDDRRGRLAPGMQADIVVLDADPAEDPRNFAKVRCALRAGKVVYQASK